jgi:hypothetical protein
VQEFGGSAVEADGSVLESGAGEQNRYTLCRSLLRSMETMLEIYPLKLDTPVCGGASKFSGSFSSSRPTGRNRVWHR